MIPLLRPPVHLPHEALGHALGRPVSTDEGLTEHTVVAHWPGLDRYTMDDEQSAWTAAQWAEHLEDPLVDNPFAASPRGDRLAVFHLTVRLHPDDRELTGAEWAEIAHRFARAAGIQIPGDDQGCRWIAVQAQPGRVDLLANLIRLDGAWQHRSANLLHRLADEAHRTEQDLRLIPAGTQYARQQALDRVPTASDQLAAVLTQIADERSGPLAAVRGLIEHTAHRAAHQHAGAAHSLELLARRLHGIQQDLDASAASLAAASPSKALPPVASARPSPRHSL
ncbi:relaxase/mobilization nuclease [Streptomyces sp. NPDC090994]|uniref:relaxase/mobilization nuclease n=1 Tax=Streptomyces sp. NPDC090994 TaxID=3365969 RepID=UPI0037F58109